MAARSLSTVAVASLLVAAVLAAGGPVGLAAAGNVGTDVGTAAGDGDWPTYGYDEQNSGNASEVDGPRGNLTTDWAFNTGAEYTASPVVVDDTVYVANGNGTLYALDAKTASVQWQRAGSFGSDTYDAAAVTDGVVYTGNGTHVEALDADTGDRYWRYDAGSTADSPPTVADGTVYAGDSDGTVYALDAQTGGEEWTFATASGTYTPSPAVANGTVYVDGGDGTLYGLDARDGSQNWSDAVADRMTPPAVANGTVYVGANDNTLYAVDASTGAEEWTFTTEEWFLGKPAVADGTVYVGVQSSFGPSFFAVDGADGSELWRQSVGSVWATPAVTSETVYVTADGGYVYGLDRETGETVGEHQMAQGTNTWSSPAVVDGRIYAGVATGGTGGPGLFAVTSAPVARIDVSETDVAVGETVSLDGSNSLDSQSGDVTTYEWDTDGDGTVEKTGEQVTTAYDRGGAYVVNLTVTDDRGVSNSTRATVHVADDSRGPLLDDWPTLGSDARRSGSDAGTGIVDGARQRMHLSVSGGGPFAIANDTIYVPSDTGLDATNASTGLLEWDTMAFSGPPTVAAERVYVANKSATGLGGLNVATGDVEWGAQTADPVSRYPVVANETVYATSTRLSGPGGTSWIHAFDAETGAQQWDYETSAVATAPTVAGDTVVAGGSHGYLFAVRAGSEVWNVSLGTRVEHAPTVVDGTVYTGTFGGTVTARDLETGSKQWEYDTGDTIEGAVAVADGRVYAGNSDGDLYALDAADGTQTWHRSFETAVAAAPAVVNGTVYAGVDTTVYGFDSASGTTEWSRTAATDRLSRVAIVGDRVYTLSSAEAPDPDLYAFEGTADTGPTAAVDASATSVETGETVTFDASNATDDVGVRRVRWTFGDGTAATGFEVNHSFAATGTYDVAATITDGAGYRASEVVTVSVASSGSEGANVDDVDLAVSTDAPDRPSTPTTPAGTDTRTTTAATESPVETTTATPTTEPGPTTGEDGPGFGPVVALVALALIPVLGRGRGG